MGSGTLSSSSGEVPEVEGADVDDLYDALDWLYRGQGRIERTRGSWLPGIWRKDSGFCGTLRRYRLKVERVVWPGLAGPGRRTRADCRSSWGCWPLQGGGAGGGRGVPQGNTGDPDTVGTVLDRVQERFGLRRVVMVGDRGMISNARIDKELRPRAVDWITALRAPTASLCRTRAPADFAL